MRNASSAGPDIESGSADRVSLFSDLVVEGIGTVYEDQARSQGYRLVAGVDEVGRGCLAGPVVAGICILDPEKPLPDGLDDSKKLTPEKRETIAGQLKAECLAYAIGIIEADVIDKINILEATKQAMLAAIGSIKPTADFLLIDALHLKQTDLPQMAIIKGDSISASIAAASVLAKTFRDDLMRNYHNEFPQYGFESNKGYGCATHYAGLREHGPCVLHRMTFRGVRADEPDEVQQVLL